MPATAALSVTPTVVSTAPAPAEPRGPTDAGRAFDSHLDAARQQQGGDTSAAAAAPTSAASADRATVNAAPADRRRSDAGTDASTAAGALPAPPSDGLPGVVLVPVASVASVDTGQPAPGTDAPASTARDEPTPDAISVAGAMLALLGQAMPANASAATGGAAKVLAASVLKASAGQPALGHLAAPSDTLATLTDAGAGAGNDTAAVVPSGNASTAGTAALADLFAAGGSKAAMHKGADGPAVQDLATLLGATPQATANTGVMPPHALHIASPAGSPAFAQELGQQVAWLGNQDIKQAKIRLHPDELGQVDVSVRVQHGGQVDVTFAAQHPAAVHALQQTLPQLDALLAQHGLSLGQAQVGQQSAGGDGSRGSNSSFGSDGVDAGGDEPIAAPVTVSALGLLDTFA